MKILFTNLSFDFYTGTQVATRDLALALTQAGHRVTIYSPRLGPIVDGVRASGVAVTGDLFSIRDAPDIIHGHHHEPLMQALLRFPSTPAIYLCHDATSQADTSFPFPRIRRYLAVDLRCQARFARELGLPAGAVEIVSNAVDTDRFQSRPPLPVRPRRALVFSNYASNKTHLPAIRKACRSAEIELDVMGHATGTASDHPETALPRYDLVFAKGRCALEAMAVGNAVVLCDKPGAGPYVTAADFDAMRLKNFGRALLTEPLSASALLKQIARYDASDAVALSARARAVSSLSAAVARWESIYSEIIAGFDAGQVDREAESRATIDYITRWHYSRRQEWEREQGRRLKRVPIVGKPIGWIGRWAVKRWKPFG
jgi:glycosyltransferase involved in cell wall biosynthesis